MAMTQNQTNNEAGRWSSCQAGLSFGGTGDRTGRWSTIDSAVWVGKESTSFALR